MTTVTAPPQANKAEGKQAEPAKVQDAPAGSEQKVEGTDPAPATEGAAAVPATPAADPGDLPVEFDGLDAEANAGFAEVAKELSLKPEAAKTLGKIAPILEARQARQIQDAMKSWDQLSTSDKEFGGPKMAENLADAYRVLEDPRFVTPELRKLLDSPEKGGQDLFRHPEVKRLFLRIGKAIGPDKIVTATRGGGNAETSLGQVFDYPSMKKQA